MTRCALGLNCCDMEQLCTLTMGTVKIFFGLCFTYTNAACASVNNDWINTDGTKSMWGNF